MLVEPPDELVTASARERRVVVALLRDVEERHVGLRGRSRIKGRARARLGVVLARVERAHPVEVEEPPVVTDPAVAHQLTVTRLAAAERRGRRAEAAARHQAKLDAAAAQSAAAQERMVEAQARAEADRPEFVASLREQLAPIMEAAVLDGER